MAEPVYVLCALTSAVCAGLLVRSWWASRSRLLLYSALCFIGLMFNNILLVLDKVVTGPEVDLALWTKVPAVLGMAIFLFGSIYEGEAE